MLISIFVGGCTTSNPEAPSSGSASSTGGNAALCSCVEAAPGAAPALACTTDDHTDCGLFRHAVASSGGSGGPDVPPEGCEFDDQGDVDCESANLDVVACAVAAQQAQEPFVARSLEVPSAPAAREVTLFADATSVLEIRISWDDLTGSWPAVHARVLPELAACADPVDAATGWQCILDAVRDAESLAECVEAGSVTTYD